MPTQAAQAVRTQTRFKPDLHAWLADRAKRNSRSFNGELMEVLKQLKDADEKQTTANA